MKPVKKPHRPQACACYGIPGFHLEKMAVCAEPVTLFNSNHFILCIPERHIFEYKNLPLFACHSGKNVPKITHSGSKKEGYTSDTETPNKGYTKDIETIQKVQPFRFGPQ